MLTTSQPATASTATAVISSNGGTTCAINSAGAMYCWGLNDHSQFGDGTQTNSSQPVLVAGSHTWSKVAVGDRHVCALDTSGAAWCWGGGVWGAYGAIGDGNSSNSDRTIPTAVVGGHTFIDIAAGAWASCAVDSSHAAWCWGDGTGGMVGDGNNNEVYSPTAVTGSHLFSSISMRSNHVCAVTTTGDGYCWGNNYQGQLGNGNTTDQNAPALVGGSHLFTSISVGNIHSCGVTTTHVAYCWGYGGQGQIGDGNWSGANTSPVLVAGSLSFASISAGWWATCGVLTNGLGSCWGTDVNGQLGSGSGTQLTPTATSSGYQWQAIAMGGTDTSITVAFACGVTTGAGVYCWGDNSVYELGDGTTTNHNTPQPTLFYAQFNNTTVSVAVDPSFTFTVANKSSACNSESNFVSGAGSASSVALGHLAAGGNVSGGQTLTVASNAGAGFSVYIRGTQATQNLRGSSHNWTDVAGSYSSPAALGSGERFGYTYKDSTTSSSVTNPSSANFAALTNTNRAVMGSTSSTAGSACVSFDAQTSASTPADSYSATIMYVAVPAF